MSETQEWPTEPTGHCASCGAPVSRQNIFCSIECWQAFKERTEKGAKAAVGFAPGYHAVPPSGTMDSDVLPVKRSERDALAGRIAALENRVEDQDKRLNVLDVADWRRATSVDARLEAEDRAIDAEGFASAEQMNAECELMARRDRLREIASQSLQTFLAMGLAPDLAAKQAYAAALELLHLIEWDERGGS